MAPRAEATSGEPRSRGGTGTDRALVQRQARALGDPTRFRIFQHVAAARHPVRVAALTAQFGLNHNAVRQHLAKLCDAQLLIEEVAVRSGPGRPALQYRVSPSASGSWGTPSPYEQLALLLVELAAGAGSARDVGGEAGRRAAALVAHDGKPSRAISLLVDEMERRGFEPALADRASGADIVLNHCPFANAAAAEPNIICEMHLGLAEGFVEGLGGEVEVAGLAVRNPHRAGCRLQIRPAAPG